MPPPSGSKVHQLSCAGITASMAAALPLEHHGASELNEIGKLDRFAPLPDSTEGTVVSTSWGANATPKAGAAERPVLVAEPFGALLKVTGSELSDVGSKLGVSAVPLAFGATAGESAGPVPA